MWSYVLKLFSINTKINIEKIQSGDELTLFDVIAGVIFNEELIIFNIPMFYLY